MPASPARVAGACLCGAVRFEIDVPAMWSAHCHCSMCRRAHGAPFVTWVGVARTAFHLTAGDAELTRYASSPGATRSFCRRCGTPLFFEAERWADQVHIARANLDDAFGQPVTTHVYFDDRAPWLTVADHLPRLGGITGTEPRDPD